jgi:hypothetical protein
VNLTAAVLAAPPIPPVTPPFASGILQIAGWVIFGVGMALVLAFAVGIAHLAWAHFHHRAGMSALSLGIVLLCGILLGSLGAIMNGLF